MRKNDPKDPGALFRSADRFFRVNDEWFFETREGHHGPYLSRGAAERGLQDYVKELEFAEQAPQAKRGGSDPDLNLKIWDRQPDSI